MSTHKLNSLMTPIRSVAIGLMTVAALMALANGRASAESKPVTVAFLGVEFLNDNAMYEPTSDKERARLKALETSFIEMLTLSGHYKFVPVSREMRETIEKGQPVGDCGGCEIDYGKALNAERIAWIRVQKVSNLILNMNVYVADVAKRKMTFERSVDIRGNTDETWARSLRWLIKNYMLPQLPS
jgi:hypothetical protein